MGSVCGVEEVPSIQQSVVKGPISPVPTFESENLVNFRFIDVL
ncbi:MAG: hypothetical protein BWY47_00812 [Bacteroidetes bacterium ADurb.Bin302]|nr:MAG: hypothetical protein BWY47_00812 [Bacteroidetes bacterium ADurb.Bin302]